MKKIIIKKISTLLCLLIATVSLNGCLITAGAVGAVWYFSTLHGTIYNKFEDTEHATVKVLKENKIQLYKTKYNKEKTSCKITGETIDGNSVEVDLKTSEKYYTDVDIKIGVWGDKTMSNHLLYSIQNKLNEEH